mmetsp:Transcript_30641/g.80389  ORF Transcript_30641/g.80389 Transcript_30641/m.80389 type:complete len:403 (-) Transcript_30641:71-1279(-)
MSFCWIDDFKKFAIRKGDKFPVPYSRFTNLFSRFRDVGTASSRRGPVAPGHYVWMDGDNVKACFLLFELDLDTDAQTDEALAEKDQWDSFLEAFRVDASDYTAGAFHTSKLWVRVEAQRALIYSTLTTLVTVFILAFLSMVIVTRNAYLSIFVTASTIGVVCGLGFVVVVVLQWEVGAIEVISLIVFVGYALDYSLHVVQKYGTHSQGTCSHAVADHRGPGHGEASDSGAGEGFPQKQRVTYALTSIGTAATGSAITTVGSAVFLLFATLTIFKDIGIMLLITTSLSIFTALVPLPAALMLCGPRDPKDHISPILRLGPRLVQWCLGMVRRSPNKALEIQDEPGDALSANKDWSQRKEVTVGLQSFQPSNDRMLEVESRSALGGSTGAIWVHVPKHVMLEAI